MDFISQPLVVGIVFYFIYKLFELIIRRRERLILIERMTSNTNCEDFKLPDMGSAPNFGRFIALRIGLILLGLGLGLIIGILITPYIYLPGHSEYNTSEMVQGASVMIFGGLGMLASFLIENKISKK